MVPTTVQEFNEVIVKLKEAQLQFTYDPGLYNGIEFAIAFIEGKEPTYLELHESEIPNPVLEDTDGGEGIIDQDYIDEAYLDADDMPEEGAVN